MRGPRFHHVLLINEMNAAVVQRPLFGLIGFPRNYLLLGLPLLESATPDEAMAVVAHEYGHLAGAHGRFGAFIYRLRLSWGTIQAIAGQWTGWTGRLLRKPVDWYAPYFNAYTFVLARTNEYQADAASAELVGTPAAASALKRVNVSGGSYERFLSTTFASARSEGTPPDDLSERWARTALAPQAAELASKDLGEALARDPGVADTHPSLRQRLLALGVAEAALNEPPPALASGLSAEALAEVRERVAAVKPKIVEAWIARRRIPVDPDAVALMLVVRFTRWSRAGKRQEALNALVGQGWPATIHVFTEDAPYAALYKRARAAGERLT